MSQHKTKVFFFSILKQRGNQKEAEEELKSKKSILKKTNRTNDKQLCECQLKEPAN